MITKERTIVESTETQLCLACSKLATYVSDEDEWHKRRCGIKNRENFGRIHIIGGPGSGKTTLARKLGAYLQTEVYELDHIAFTGRDFEERPFPDRVVAIDGIANRPTWITEGLFVQWTDELLVRADIIVWLDHLNWERGFLRIARRFVKSAIQEGKKRYGLERFMRFSDYARHMKQLIQVFFSSRAYYETKTSRPTGRIESRHTTAAVLKHYRDKVVHCYDDDAIEAFIEYIRLCESNVDKEKDYD